eukprot:scaffold44083_cov64-Cyclotella_meneghiniana.AAC.1
MECPASGALVLFTNASLANATVSASQEQGWPQRRLFVVVAAAMVGLTGDEKYNETPRGDGVTKISGGIYTLSLLIC